MTSASSHKRILVCAILCILACLVVGCLKQYHSHAEDNIACTYSSRASSNADTLAIALSAARQLAHCAWPCWTPGAVPIIYMDSNGSQWLFLSGEPPSVYVAAFSTDLGITYLLSKANLPTGEKISFQAHASLEGGKNYFRIASPDAAPFSFVDWCAVFSHEYFHCYQLSDREWLKRFKLGSEGTPPMKELQRLFVQEPWFQQDIQKETQLLHSLLSSQGKSMISLQQLLELRESHRRRLEIENPRLPGVEEAAELVEGTARYVEFSLYGCSKATDLINQNTQGVLPADNLAEQARGLDASTDRYYYATGYGLSMLLQSYGHPWQNDLPQLGYDELLRRELLLGVSRNRNRKLASCLYCKL